MKILLKRALFLLMILLLISGTAFGEKGDKCKIEEAQKNADGNTDGGSKDPTFVQVSSKDFSEYEIYPLNVTGDSPKEALFSYEKSLISTTPEVQVVSSLPSWLTISGNTNVLDLADEILECIELTFAATAGTPANSSAEVTLNLVDVGTQEVKTTKVIRVIANKTLTAKISVPLSGSLVRAMVPIFGQAGGEEFASYTVEYGAGINPTVWTPIVTSSTPQMNDTSPIVFMEGNLTIYGNLATWETGLTEYDYPWYPWSIDLNGIYTVRLRVKDISGHEVSDEVILQVGRVAGSTYASSAVSPDGNIVLYIPEQAIEDDFQVIAINSLDSQSVSIDEGYNLIGQVYEIQSTGIEFTKTVTLEMYYSDADLAGGDEAKLCIYAYNSDTGRWDYLPTTVDTVNNKLTALITKIGLPYTYFAIFEKVSLPQKPVLNQPPSPTQDRLITIAGTSDPNLSIEFYVNGFLKAETTAASDGAFSLDNLPLSDGINEITAKAIDQFGQISPESEAVTVVAAEPALTVNSLKFKNADYSADFTGTVDLGDTLYIQIDAVDPDPNTKDKTSVSLTSSQTDPQGIDLQLEETETASGIFRGRAEVDINSSQSQKTIAAYQESEIITAVSLSDSSKSDSVTFNDNTPSPAPTITSSTHPSVCQNTFENGLDQWSNRDGDAGATLFLENAVTPDNTNALELINQLYGGNFASNIRTTAFDASQYPMVSFDYKITEDVKINFLVKLEGDETWYDIVFTDDPKNYWRLNMELIGAVEGVIKDDTWRHAEFNLYEMLKARTDNFQVKELIMADWDSTGYMKLVYGTNPGGAAYCIDNFNITARGFNNNDPQITISVPDDPSGIIAYSYILDKIKDTIPDTTADGSSNLINYTDIDDGIWYFRARLQDGSGNWSEANHYQVFIDTQGPDADTPSPAPYASSGNPVISLHLTDNQGTGVDPQTIRLGVEGGEYDINSPALTYDEETETLTFNPSAIGIIWPDYHLVNIELIRADDYLGNVLQNALSWQWTLDYSLDTTLPEAPVITLPTTHNVTCNKVTFIWKAEDANGIVDYSFILDENAGTIADDTGEGLITSKIYDLAVGSYYFHVKAKDRAGNWSETTHYQITIGESASLLVDDFNDGSDPNEAGGWSGVWGSDNGSCQASYYNADLNNTYGQTGYSLQLAYDVSQADAYTGYWTAISIDLAEYKALSFWIKGDAGGERLKVGLKDTSYNETKVLADDYLFVGVTTDWQKVIIPLSAFTSIANWASMDSISISFDNNLGGPASGSVYVDELRFEKTIEPIIVSTFNGAGDHNSLGGAIETFAGGLGTISGSYDAANAYNNSAYGYNLTYSGIASPNNYAVWKCILNNLDASNCNSLSFYIKGSVGGEKSNIYLGYSREDNSYDRRFVDIRRYTNITTDWQRVNIPLLDFIAQGVDVGRLVEIQVVFEGEEMSGVIYLDDIHFATVDFSEAPVIDVIPGITNQENITVTGTGAPGQTIIPVVEVPNCGRWEQSPVIVGEDGTFTAMINISGEGYKCIYVYAIDENGNVTLNSAVQATVLDQTAPAVPTVNEIDSPVSDPLVNVSGTAETNTAVYIWVNQPISGLVEYSTQAVSAAYNMNITLTDGDGSYQLTTASQDAAGNWSIESSPPVEIILDAVNEAPNITVISPDGKEVISSDTFNLLWQAADPDPADTLNIDIQYSNSLNQTLVDDFSGGHWTNCLDALSETWSGAGAGIEVIFNSNPAIVYDGSGISLQLNYNTAGGYAGYLTGLCTQPDMSAYAYISLLIKGSIGQEMFKIGLKDSSWTETKLLVTNYLPGGVTTDWQKVTIPLSDFGNVESSILDNFSITFADSVGSGSGTVYFDEIRFIKWQDLALDEVNDGIYCLKTIGLPQGDRYLIKVTACDASGSAAADESNDYFTLANNLAKDKITSASSEENQGTTPSMAVDGSLNTRWSSQHFDPQWYQIDLGGEQPVNKVILKWESAYGKSYSIQVSSDSTNWTDVYSTTTSDGDIDEIEFSTVSAGYIRLYGTERGTPWGYSLWEFEVYYDTHYADVVASSIEETGFEAQKSFDGDFNTRWSSASTDNEWIYFGFGLPKTFNTVILNWETAYAESYELQVSNDAVNWTTIYSTASGDGGADVVYVGEQTAGYLKVSCTQPSTGWGYSLWEIDLFTTTATGSSIEGGGLEADRVIDGDPSTRWSSQHFDPQWLQLDFGSIQTVNKIILDWETAYAKSYQLQISDNAVDWRDIYTVTDSGGGTDEIISLLINTRYLRMYGTERGTPWGYSLWEMEAGYER